MVRKLCLTSASAARGHGGWWESRESCEGVPLSGQEAEERRTPRWASVAAHPEPLPESKRANGRRASAMGEGAAGGTAAPFLPQSGQEATPQGRKFEAE
eukprot:5304307-Alexandrium_andersonii.AAC.1